MGAPREPFTCVYRGIWHDKKFRRRSELGQRVYLYLLSSPLGNGLGCYRATREAMAGDLRMTPERFSEGFEEGWDPRIGDALYYYDEEAQVVWIPAYLRRNPPSNPNGVRALAKAFLAVPDCRAKLACYRDAEAHTGERGPEFSRAFRESFQTPSVPADECGETLPLTFAQRSPEDKYSASAKTACADPASNVAANVARTLPPTLPERSGNVTLPSSHPLTVTHSPGGECRAHAGDGTIWTPDDPRGRESGWDWGTIPGPRLQRSKAMTSTHSHLSWAVRLQWYWPQMDPEEAAEIAVQILKRFADEGLDIREQLARAAATRPRREGTAGLRRFLASWMSIEAREARRGRPAEKSRPVPPPVSEVIPDAPARTPEEEAAIAAERAVFFAIQRGGGQSPSAEPAAGPVLDALSDEQRAVFEGIRARARAANPDALPDSAGSLAAAALSFDDSGR
jgi:hypothetical protein